jgi:sulfur carrier protein ThiS
MSLKDASVKELLDELETREETHIVKEDGYYYVYYKTNIRKEVLK